MKTLMSSISSEPAILWFFIWVSFMTLVFGGMYVYNIVVINKCLEQGHSVEECKKLEAK